MFTVDSRYTAHAAFEYRGIAYRRVPTAIAQAIALSFASFPSARPKSCRGTAP
jgi:hypothetical protein